MKSEWFSASEGGRTPEPDYKGGAQFSQSNGFAEGSGEHVGNHQISQLNGRQCCG